MTRNTIGPSREIVTNSAPSSDPVRFCKDCKWFVVRDGGYPENGRCRRVEVILGRQQTITAGEALVTGIGVFACFERAFGKECGPRGLLFEPLPLLPARPNRFVWAALLIVAVVLGVVAAIIRYGGAS